MALFGRTKAQALATIARNKDKKGRKRVGGGSQPTVTVPAAPTIGTATVGNGMAFVPYTDNSDGGAVITSHDVQIYNGSGVLIGTITNVANPAFLTAAQGIINGSSYSFKVRANNEKGPSAYSSMSNIVTPAIINPVLPTAYLIESFEDTTGFTIGGGATPAINPDWKVQGTNSLKLTGALSNATATATKTIAGTFDPKVPGTIALMANVDPSTAGQVVQAGAGFVKGTTATVSPLAGYTQSPPALRTGPAIIAASIEKEMNAIYVQAAGTGYSLRVSQSQGSSGGSIVSYDGMIGGARGIPTILIGADDQYSDQYAWLYQQHLARGIPFNINIARDVIGTANRFTEAQFNEMFASGIVGIGLNGTCNDAACDQNDVVAATTGSNGIIANQDYVVSKGWITDRTKLVMGCWPFGTWSEALCVAFENAGIKHMRTTQPGVQLGNMHTRFGRTPQWMTAWTYSMGGKTEAQLKAAYDLCKAGGYTLNLFGHHWYETPGASDVSQAAYVALLDYMMPDIIAGTVQVLKFQDWIARDGNNTFPVL